MFSEAISSISWRCRPSSPRIAAAISGSASLSGAVKNESGAEEAFAPEDEELMGKISPPPQPVMGVAVGQGGGRKRYWRVSISGRNGQALAVGARDLCQIWWAMVNLHGRARRARHGRA